MSVASGCTGLEALNPLCQAAGAASGVLAGGVGGVLQATTQWVVGGASWLLGQIGGVVDASSSVDLGAGWFETHYQVMLGVLGIVVVPAVLGSVIQAVLRQDGGLLVRSMLVNLPLALLLAGMAVKVVQLALGATDALSAAVASGAGGDVHQALQAVVSGLAVASVDSSVPSFVLLLVALLVVLGALALWVELLVRSAAVSVAVLFLPLALGSLVWPAIAHWCRRLVDTLAALILSKFVIVAILSLAAGALAAGTSGSSAGTGTGGTVPAVLGGAALLLLAAFSPYTLLRLLPMAEAGAMSGLEGVRHRAQRAATTVPRDAARFALRQARLGAFDPGVPGTGIPEHFEAAGGDDDFGSAAAGADGLGEDGPAAGGPDGPPDGGDGGLGGVGGIGGMGDDRDATAAGDEAGEADPAGGGGRPGSRGAPRGTGRRGGGATGAGGRGAAEGGSDGGGGDGGAVLTPPPFSDIPMWRGDPSSQRIFDDVMAGRRAADVPEDPHASVLRPDPSGGTASGRSWDRGRHEIIHDAMGPVIRWIPPEEADD